MPGPVFVDLFAGSGGLSLGLKRAGWRCALAVDNWADATRTHRQNFSDHPVVEVDIRDVTPASFAKCTEDRPEWIVGGPPCQGFSTIGKRSRSDPRNLMVREFHRLVKQLRPDGFLIENVLGLKDMRFESAIRGLFQEIGYQVAFHVLRAADYGVPQLRRRVIFVGHVEHGFFQGPCPTHDEANHRTVWDAIGDLPELGPGEAAGEYDKSAETDYQVRMRRGSTCLQGHVASNHPPRLVKAISFIPDGGNRQAIPPEYQPRSGYHNSYSRLSSLHPAVAVTSNMGKPSATRCIHPFQHRGLTAREGARLQSFPDRFHFAAGSTSQRLQIANAVPPLLAERIGLGIVDESRWSMSRGSRSAEPQLHLELAA